MLILPERNPRLDVVSDAEVDRLTAARDRAAAALDRVESTLARSLSERYLRESYRDALTGALQRSCGRDRLIEEVARAHRTGVPLVLAFLDVVGLKRVNDTLGHAAGDQVLAAVGSALVAQLRTYDVVVRYGGDEFVCLLPHSSFDDASNRMEEVRTSLRSDASGIAVSIGLAELSQGESLDDLVGRADRAMYAARRRTGGARSHMVPDPGKR